MLILSHYARFMTKNSAREIKTIISPIVQILTAPNDLAISNIIGQKASMAAER